ELLALDLALFEVAGGEEARRHVGVRGDGEEQLFHRAFPTVTRTLFMAGSSPGSGGKSGGSGRSLHCQSSRRASRAASWTARRSLARPIRRWFVEASRRPPGAVTESASDSSFVRSSRAANVDVLVVAKLGGSTMTRSNESPRLAAPLSQKSASTSSKRWSFSPAPASSRFLRARARTLAAAPPGPGLAWPPA